MDARSARRYPPKRGAEVRVVIGSGRGARGILRSKKSKWGIGLVEGTPDSPKLAGKFFHARAWRLVQSRSASRSDGR